MSYLLFDRKIIDEVQLNEMHNRIELAYSKILGLIKHLGLKINEERKHQ